MDLRIRNIDNEISEFTGKIGELKEKKRSNDIKKADLSKKLDASITYNSKEKIVQNTVQKLKDFIKKFKEEKKKSFENGILDKLNMLLHKKNFVKKVDVYISPSGDDVDINLYNQRNEKIDKAELSMGVIIFPLIHKEMTESEYLLLKNKVSKSYLIENKNIDYSQFKEVSPDNLITTYNQLYNNAN